MSVADPLRALAAGVRVVTPNNRLARSLSARHDAAMAASGRTAWTAARVLPWNAWLATLWRDAIDAGAVTARLVAPLESRYLWQRIVGDDPALAQGLTDARGVAELAAQAWTLVHAWGAGGSSWRAWRETALAPPASDADAFARWAQRYARELAERDALDLALLGDALAAALLRAPQAGRAGSDGQALYGAREPVLLAGFLEWTPQQQRLLDALRAAGGRVTIYDEPAARGQVERVQAPTPRDEVVLALQWARERALAHPASRIGIAVSGLEARRDEVRALAEEVLCPALLLPGQEGHARPFDLSLGLPLAASPVVGAALHWLALAHGDLARSDAAALMRSPFGAGPWAARAGVEKRWLEESRLRIPAAEIVAAVQRADAAGAQRLREALADARTARVHTPREWAARWRRYLAQCGWPGEATLAGREFEAQQAFAKAIDDVERLDVLGVRWSSVAALGVLRDHVSSTIFQAQGAGGPVVIMGLLEAASVEFDALWIAGLSGQEWPPAPRPNPLLPLSWQREREVPRASAARELAFARRVTERLLRCAPEVVVSAPAVLGDAQARPTALLEGTWPALARPDAEDVVRRIAAAGSVEALRDERAPPLPAGPVSGGTGLIAAQSDCPFKATAKYRLRTEPWPEPSEGLSPLERGKLAHALMAAFWNDVRTHGALVALDDDALAKRVDVAAATARAAIDDERWRALPAVVAAAEALRLPRIALDWIERIERPRAGFTVLRSEARTTVTLAGLTLSLTLDRLDALSGGGAAIVDYKAGQADAPRTWFDVRPRSPQLGIYLLALQEEVPPVDVRAMAYGRLKAGEVAALGVAAQATQWPVLLEPAKAAPELGSWPALVAFFEARLPALAAEIRDGVASVTPRPGAASPCRLCARQSLCRIAAVRNRTALDEEADA